jgi:hypothetical protein
VKPVFTIVGAAGFVALANYLVNSPVIAAPPSDSVRGETSLRRYCADFLGGKRTRADLARKSDFHPRDCIALFVPGVGVEARGGQPGRGGDGGGFPGVPGGRGGESGALGGRGGEGGSILFGRSGDGPVPIGPPPEELAGDPEFISYCTKILQSRRRATSSDFMPSDCAYYFLALDRLAKLRPGKSSASGKDGPDGPSINGGVGGKGGRAGSGPGGGAGGAGGPGAEGGLGGAGGAGGASR